jgi:hypothetical protein
MNLGEVLTRSTIWISLSCYVLGTVLFATRNHSHDRLVRIIWTIAIIALGLHFIAAFHYYHHWSQLSAYQETARQTNDVFGLNWGGGLIINYTLLLIWMFDVGSWWHQGLLSYRRRALPWLLTWHGFLLFIIFNATVVFKDGIQRWVGLLISLILSLAWYSFITSRKVIQAK